MANVQSYFKDLSTCIINKNDDKKIDDILNLIKKETCKKSSFYSISYNIEDLFIGLLDDNSLTFTVIEQFYKIFVKSWEACMGSAATCDWSLENSRQKFHNLSSAMRYLSDLLSEGYSIESSTLENKSSISLLDDIQIFRKVTEPHIPFFLYNRFIFFLKESATKKILFFQIPNYSIQEYLKISFFLKNPGSYPPIFSDTIKSFEKHSIHSILKNIRLESPDYRLSYIIYFWERFIFNHVSLVRKYGYKKVFFEDVFPDYKDYIQTEEV